MSFNYGADPVVTGGSIKQAAAGQHEARLSGIIHLGQYEDTFGGKKKPAAPFVCALFELKSGEEGGGINDDGTPIMVHKSFALKKGDRATLTKFMKVMLTPEEFKQYEAGVLEGGFEDFIGRPLLIDMEGSKKKEDNGEASYTNVAGMSKMPAKLAKLCEELELESVGHVPFDKLDELALRTLPPFEIWGKLEESIDFPGSAVEEVLAAIRKETPDFGTKKAKDDDDKGDDKAPPERKREDLNEEEDFS
jgi:hypothetical protein